MSKNERFFWLLSGSAAWGTFVVPASIAAIMVALRSETTQFAAVFPWVLLFTAVPSVLLSVVAALWLGAVAARSRHAQLLPVHGLWMGVLMSLPFCVFGLLNSTGASAVGSFLLITILVGALNGLGFSLAFRKLLLLNDSVGITNG